MLPFESLSARTLVRALPINYKRLIFPARSSIIAARVNVTDCVCADKKRCGENENGEGVGEKKRNEMEQRSRPNKYRSHPTPGPRPLQIL